MNELENIIKTEVAAFNQKLVNEELAAELLEDYLKPNMLLGVFIKRLPFIEVLSSKTLKQQSRYGTSEVKALHLIETYRNLDYFKLQQDCDYHIQDVEVLKVKFKGETYLIYGGMRWKFACHSENIGYDPDHDFDIGDFTLEILSVVSVSELQRKIAETSIEELGILTALNNFDF